MKVEKEHSLAISKHQAKDIDFIWLATRSERKLLKDVVSSVVCIKKFTLAMAY